jgi:putative ATP-dependent endonuclease of OLD family
MYVSSLRICNFRCIGVGDDAIEVNLRPGLTTLVGANDAGKTAVIDALRFALGTTDQERLWLEDSDFHVDGQPITVVCVFQDLSEGDLATFAEYLTYGELPTDKPILIVNWIADYSGTLRGGRAHHRIEVRSGKEANGPTISPEVRLLLQATYLRPLRDAEVALTSGRGSRLAQVLKQSPLVRTGADHDVTQPLSDQRLSILAIAKLMSDLLSAQQSVAEVRTKIDASLLQLALHGEKLNSVIRVAGATAVDDRRLRELLEKLDLRIDSDGKIGLGSDNLLFMACELLLLSQEAIGNKLLLIEEPEAHLHAQRQLRVMRSLQDQAKKDGIQIIVSTHSPNLTSAVELGSLVVMRNRRAFSLSLAETQLTLSDRQFLERFLEATKANLFFAYGVLIVEGDAENILLPTLAKIIGRDLTEHGVSIVNVGGTGLGRYARIFQRSDPMRGLLDIPVACITDMDVMPDVAPEILGRVSPGTAWPALSPRRWRAKRDFPTSADLTAHRTAKISKIEGQAVKAFVSDEWTLEYDLALGPKSNDGTYPCGLAKDVFIASFLADADDKICSGITTVAAEEVRAEAEYQSLLTSLPAQPSREETLASKVYARFSDGASKPIAAQYLAERFLIQFEAGTLTTASLRSALPKYIVDAIDYATGQSVPITAS